MKIISFTSVTAFIFLTFAAGAYAAGIVDVEFPCPDGSWGLGTCPVTGGPDITAFIVRIYQVAIAIAGILAVAIIVTGSLFYTFSGGSTDRQREGKDMITSALWGIALLFGSYLVLNTVNPELVRLKNPALTEKFTPTKQTISNDCGPFENIAVWNGNTTISTGNLKTLEVPGTTETASCAVQIVEVLKGFKITHDGAYYDENENIDVTEQVSLYPYFRRGTDPKTTARCLVYHERPDLSATVDKSSNDIDISNLLALCAAKPQATRLFSQCSLWKLTGIAYRSGILDQQKISFTQSVDAGFAYQDPTKPPPTDRAFLEKIGVRSVNTPACFKDMRKDGLPFCKNLQWTCTAGQPTAPPSSTVTPANQTACKDCAAIPSSIPSKPGSADPATPAKLIACRAATCELGTSLATKLTELKRLTDNPKGAGGLARTTPLAWQVTEAWPPTVTHKSTCHANGTCTDVALTGGAPTCADVNDFAALARAAKFTDVLNEYENCGGTTFETTTGGHLHLSL